MERGAAWARARQALQGKEARGRAGLESAAALAAVAVPEGLVADREGVAAVAGLEAVAQAVRKRV
jgi:hypothetical protein